MRGADTIAAIATPPGRGGIGVIRVSGPDVQTIINAILGKSLQARYATHTHFLDENGKILDQGLALYFPAPHSFTGEDVVEFQGHGGPVILDCVLRRILNLGARLARPGEFSERAFLNNKLDLAQAEAVADLIDAGSEQAARAAVRSLQGEFSKKIQQLTDALIHLRMYVEAAIDFPEEEIDFLTDGKIAAELNHILAVMAEVKSAAQQGALLREGMTVVLAGRPNAGKSSLLNCLTGRDSAIVTPIPGTTRDILREHIHMDGMPVHVIDTAGLRDSIDVVEQEGVRRAWDEINKADRILLLVDSQMSSLREMSSTHADILETLPTKIPLTFVRNKIDLSDEGPQIIEQDDVPVITLSAKTGDGVALLQQHLKDSMNFDAHQEGNFTARRRHLDALERAYQTVLIGQQQLEQHRAGELLAEDLRQAQQILNEITGKFTSDDLLGRIFSSFCIGK